MPTNAGQQDRRHPIGVVAERTGLSLDVLRVWERRYGVVAPTRSPGGQRLYSDDDIVRLRLLHAATRGGRSISQVAHLATSELGSLVAEDEEGRARAGGEPSPPPGEEYVVQAMERALQLDGEGLEVVLRRAMVSLGLWGFAQGVVTPLLRRIGDGWHAGQVTPAQEHLASAAIRRVLLSGTDLLLRGSGSGGMVVATPSGDRHEIGALLVAAGASLEGWQVTYLGSDLPVDEIAAAAVETEARAVALSVGYVTDHEYTLQQLRALRAQLPADVALLLGGAVGSGLAHDLAGTGIRVLEDLAALRMVLRGDP